MLNNIEKFEREIRIPKCAPLEPVVAWDDDSIKPPMSEMRYDVGYEVHLKVAALALNVRDPMSKHAQKLPHASYTTLSVEWQGTSRYTYAMTARAEVYPTLKMPSHAGMIGHMYLPGRAEVESEIRHKIEIQLGNWNSKSKAFVIGPGDMHQNMLRWFHLPEHLFHRINYPDGVRDSVVLVCPRWQEQMGDGDLYSLGLRGNTVLLLDI